MESNWLNNFAENITSQCGEDGIIEKIVEIINIDNGWCVEFGAWDGVLYSNTHNLIKKMGYSGVLIEADKKRFLDLSKTYDGNSKVIALNAFVGFERGNDLDSILDGQVKGIPLNFDVLSIDIDGNDYHVWESVTRYCPKIVVIEYNPTIPNQVEFIQAKDVRVAQGSSILSIYKLAKSKGYELVAATELNAIFVAEQYFSLFDIKDNSLDAMRTDNSRITYIFNGYDGTVFIRGCGTVRWHDIPYRESKVQHLPKCLRKYPDSYSRLQRVLAKFYRYLVKNEIL
jgi:hypothetical protein